MNIYGTYLFDNSVVGISRIPGTAGHVIGEYSCVYCYMIVHSDDGATSKIVGIQRLPNRGGISIFEFNRRNNKNNHNPNNVPTLMSISLSFTLQKK